MSATPVVVKIGGSCLEDMSAAWWDELADVGRDQPLILVHGWSKPLKRLDARYADPSSLLRDRYGNQSRWTTPRVIADIKKVATDLGGDILDQLARRGLKGGHLFGCEGLLRAGEGERWWWQGKKLVEIDNLVGPIVGVDAARLEDVAPGSCLLVTPLATNGVGDEVNTDADRAAAAVAGAIGAESLVLVTDVEHLLIDDEPVRRITSTAAARFRDQGATGGMRKKLRAANEALDQGVRRAVIGNASVSSMVAEESGTVITTG